MIGFYNASVILPFRRKKLYRVFIKYFAPICLIIILLSSIANVLGIISM